MKKITKDIIFRFLETDIFTASPDGCHYWLGPTAPNGYGRFQVDGKAYYAHRASYQYHKGNPIGLFVCHACDNRLCVNPDHLFLGSALDNTRDMINKGRAVFTGAPSDLCDMDVIEIKALHRTGKYTQYEIADMFNVKQPCISRIVRLKRRSSVNEPEHA